MKRLLAALIGTLILATGTAHAIPGPDPNNGHDTFTLSMGLLGAIPDDTTFAESAGWDFGDRSAYRCAWVEFFRGGTEQFEVQYHAVSDYTDGTIQINDRYGEEAPDNNIDSDCWGNDDQQNFVADGSDHFPHGTSLVFNDIATGVQIGRIDYPTQCTKLYWTPGNQAAEAWLWWDEDGPADRMEHGDGLCGGGPGEPVALVQARVRKLASGIEACVTDSMDGDMCSTASGSTTHATTVTLRLRGSIRAAGSVRVADGTAECKQDRVVTIQRRALSGWKKVGKDRTDNAGGYSEHIRNRDGVYRARLIKATLNNGDTCRADVSKRSVRS